MKGRKTILVVEDDPVIRNLLVHALQLEGYVILEAPGGNEALGLLALNRVDLVLSDFEMCEGNGLDLLCGMWKCSRPVPPLAFITGSSEMGPCEAKELGAVAFFPKPFELENLVAWVEAFLGGVHLGRGSKK